MNYRVGLIGAGAVGAYFIEGLAQKENVQLYVIAKGERRKRLSKGIVINGVRHFVDVREPEEVENLDVLLVACKYNALYDVLDDIRCAVSSQTVVLSLLNGVDSEDIIAQVIPYDQILYAYMMISSQRNDSGVTFNPSITPGLFYGEKDCREISDRMKKLADILSDTNIHYTPLTDIMQGQWNKFALNIMHNLPQAVIGCGLGAYEDSEHLKTIAQLLRSEVYQVAKAKGIEIEEFIDTKKLIQVRKAARYSTLQDLDAKRETEIEMLAGALMRMAKEAGISVPYTTMIYHFIKAREQQNQGLFDYEEE